jgi:hypothetical protein
MSILYTWQRLALASCAGLFACGDNEPARNPETAGGVSGIVTLNTFITDFIEIDQQHAGTLDPNDANLFTGADRADGSPSYQVPGNGPFIDWDDLGGDLATNHLLMDLNDELSGKDRTSFPQSNSCVGPSRVLSKMDLTYIASANNTQYGYFAVQRSNNNGDAGYYWLFTRKVPHQVAGAGPCSATQQYLTYDISGPSDGATGDVLLAGHFHPNGTPLLRVFTANTSTSGLAAVDAIDFTNPIWTEDTSGVAAVAINETIAAWGAFDHTGVVGIKDNALDTEIFAEAAVNMNVFTGGSTCGATFYGSVITRASGAGGTSPDLKDLAGPALFNFGTISATPRLTANCDGKVSFSVAATGVDGLPLKNPTCSWVCDGNPEPISSCSDSINLGTGDHTCQVTVSDSTSSCSVTETSASVTVYPPITADPTLTGDCANDLAYAWNATGGSGKLSCEWAFSGGLGSSTAPSGTFTGVPAGTYSATLLVTDLVSGCTVRPPEVSAPTYAPLSVGLALAAPVPACPSDAAAFQATAMGGTGAYNYEWHNCSSTTSSCTFDPSNDDLCMTQDIWVNATDANLPSLCAPATSPKLTYTKLTTITVQ